MKLLDIRDEFISGHVSKKKYIENMYSQKHVHLFDYSSYIANTNIKSIQIIDDSVLMTSRNRGVIIELLEGDLRNHPIEILNFLDVEKEELEMIENLLRNGDSFYDVGANIGWHSLNLAVSNKTLKIYAFEPVPSTYKSLLRNIKLNNLENIETFNFGLSNHNGTEKFYFKHSVSGNSSLRNLDHDQDSEILECNFVRLDDFLSESSSKVDFIKCDVEGAELFVLQGAKHVIEKNKPIIFAEILRKFSKVFDYDPNIIFTMLGKNGYLAYTIKRGFLNEFTLMNENTLDTNFFFLHKEKHREYISRFGNPK